MVCHKAGFKNIQIKKEKLIELPDELLLKYINQEELNDYKKSGSGIYSITIYADKLEEGACCDATNNVCCTSEYKAVQKKES